MRKIFLILFITFICLDLKAEKITKDNIKHVVTKKMYENDFDEFNFKVLETETNEIIKKQDLKKLTCDILFELKKVQ